MRIATPVFSDIPLPVVHPVDLAFPRSPLTDVTAAVAAALDDGLSDGAIQAGHRVAVAVGSRGITGIAGMVAQVCRCLKDIGALPEIIPAMGSHGGATAEGQIDVLARLGITEAACGAPIIANMAVAEIARTGDNVPVFYSRDAMAADHTILINRIKPHTKFTGAVESGLVKMLVVGLGKHRGAQVFHQWALRLGFVPLLAEMGRAALAHGNLRFGIGIVEDAASRPVRVAAVPAAGLFDGDAALLAQAREWFPRLPVSWAHVLVVHRIGKDISGAGMDPNVTGRAGDLGESDFSRWFRADRLAVLGLTDATGGNALGVGYADLITDAVGEAMDPSVTATNAVTSLSLQKARIPLQVPTDRCAVQTCIGTIGPVAPEAMRGIFIRNTRHLNRIFVTSAVLPAMAAVAHARPGKSRLLPFDNAGRLTLFDDADG